jgi:tRNA pseudouridine38-40 synthase
MTDPGRRGDAPADDPRAAPLEPALGRRWAALLEYDGSAYAGWQSQTHAKSLQDRVEAALGFVAGAPVAAVCAGRTDAGVHALGQVIHFDTAARRTPRAWVLGANTRLPPDISLQWAGEVAPDFHARHTALRRIYRYHIVNRSARPALAHLRTTWIHRPLDVDAMRIAAHALLGEHDFSAFRSVECQSKSKMRRVERISVDQDRDSLCVEISANAYLHHMVRNIVGTLLEVQSERDPQGAMRRILESRDRRLAGATAPAAGLYLCRVEYPAIHAIPAPIGQFCYTTA